MRAMVRLLRRRAMLFRNIYLKTLRDYRIAILGWGLGIGLLIYVVLSSFPSLVETPEARVALVSLGPSFAWIAEPIKIDTPGGYATFKYGFTVLVMALWPLLASSRMLRGEEERGSMDVLLSMPRGRGRVALEKLAAIWTALLGMGLLIGLLTYAGGMRVNADFSLGDALLSGLNLALICGVFGSLALLISQFTQERGTAAGLTGGLLLIFIVLDMVHRVIPNTEWISRLSPIYYYNLNKPLVPGYGINAGALLVLLALSIILSGVAIATNATILSALFTFLPLLLMAFAVTQVNRWAADEEDGRLELVLATPQPRLNVLLARFAALTTVIVIIGVLTLAATELAALAAGLQLDGRNVAVATLSMIPMGLLIAAIGFLFSGWLRTAIDTGLLSFLLVIWFFITFVGPELNWPEGVQKLSAFYYYGTPLLHGLSLGNMLLVLVVAVVALALASARFVRKDIGR